MSDDKYTEIYRKDIDGDGDIDASVDINKKWKMRIHLDLPTIAKVLGLGSAFALLMYLINAGIIQLPF